MISMFTCTHETSLLRESGVCWKLVNMFTCSVVKSETFYRGDTPLTHIPNTTPHNGKDGGYLAPPVPIVCFEQPKRETYFSQSYDSTDIRVYFTSTALKTLDPSSSWWASVLYGSLLCVGVYGWMRGKLSRHLDKSTLYTQFISVIYLFPCILLSKQCFPCLKSLSWLVKPVRTQIHLYMPRNNFLLEKSGWGVFCYCTLQNQLWTESFLYIFLDIWE